MRVAALEDNGVAAAAGIKIGDIILRIDNVDVSSAGVFRQMESSHQPGDSVQLLVQTPGLPQRSVSARLTAPRPFPSGECLFGRANLDFLVWTSPKGEFTVADLIPAYAQSGLQIGDLILEMDGQKYDKQSLDTVGKSLIHNHVVGEIVRLKVQHVTGSKSEVQVRVGCRVVVRPPQAFERWRTALEKPPLPEIANRYRVLAEAAYNEKNLYLALVYYERGLAAYPFWPQGWFNTALLSAELRDFKTAAEFMKSYVALVPDAANAQSAREQMYIWEEKGKQ